jgi:hypothetical protein
VKAKEESSGGDNDEKDGTRSPEAGNDNKGGDSESKNDETSKIDEDSAE